MTYDEFVTKTKYFVFNLVIANEYFDPYNRDDPVQTTTNDQYYITFSADRYAEYEVFIEKNTYEIESGNIFGGKQSGEFYSADREK